MPSAGLSRCCLTDLPGQGASHTDALSMQFIPALEKNPMQLGGSTAWQAGVSCHVCTPRGSLQLGRGADAILLVSRQPHFQCQARTERQQYPLPAMPFLCILLANHEMAHSRVASSVPGMEVVAKQYSTAATALSMHSSSAPGRQPSMQGSCEIYRLCCLSRRASCACWETGAAVGIAVGFCSSMRPASALQQVHIARVLQILCTLTPKPLRSAQLCSCLQGSAAPASPSASFCGSRACECLGQRCWQACRSPRTGPSPQQVPTRRRLRSSGPRPQTLRGTTQQPLGRMRPLAAAMRRSQRLQRPCLRWLLLVVKSLGSRSRGWP